MQPLVCLASGGWWIYRIFRCLFLVWSHLHVEIHVLCCLCMTNMPATFVFVQILCRLCSVGVLCWVYSIPFASWTASFIFLAASLVCSLHMALCLMFWLSFGGQTRLGLFLVLSLQTETEQFCNNIVFLLHWFCDHFCMHMALYAVCCKKTFKMSSNWSNFKDL